MTLSLSNSFQEHYNCGIAEVVESYALLMEKLPLEKEIRVLMGRKITKTKSWLFLQGDNQSIYMYEDDNALVVEYSVPPEAIETVFFYRDWLVNKIVDENDLWQANRLGYILQKVVSERSLKVVLRRRIADYLAETLRQ